LLRLVRILPPVTQKKKKADFGDDDFDFEIHKEDAVSNENIANAFRMVLRYFE